MSIEQKRKSLARKLSKSAKETTAWKISRLHGAPTVQSVDRLLKGGNANINTLLFVADALGLKITLTTSNPD